MKEITIYTDGACSGNPGPGGWACILIYQEKVLELSGYMPETTNNRMEVFAVIKAIEALKQPCMITIYSDSSYLVNAFNQHWIDNWQKNGWKTTERKPVENQDLWKYLLMIQKEHEVVFKKVKGHSNNKWNNRCDELATNEIKAHHRLGDNEKKTSRNSGFTKSLTEGY